MTQWSVSTLRLQITKTVKRDRTEPLFELANLFIYGGLFYSHFQVSRQSPQKHSGSLLFHCKTQRLSLPVAAEKRAGGRASKEDDSRQVRWVKGWPTAEREERCSTRKCLPNAWVLFPKPLIFSDYAVVTGFRLGGSQGKMPTLLLGCLPWRHSLQITDRLHYYNETFGDCFLQL